MSITVTTFKPHTYAGKRRRVGDTYPVRGQSDLRVIKALGWGDALPQALPAAVAAPAHTTPARSAYRTTAIEQGSYETKQTTAAKRAAPRRGQGAATGSKSKE